MIAEPAAATGRRAEAVVDQPSGKHAQTENFPVGSVLIRADLRRHVHAFYRFARTADDIADSGELSAAEKVRRLDRMAAVLEGDGGADAPAATAMRASLAETGLAPANCLDLLVAFRRDATKLRYTDWDDLMDYCRYSAAPVGRQLLELHGAPDAARPASDALCNALQVLNHLQDCADDYRVLDRVYLPVDMLAASGSAVADLAAGRASPWLRQALDRVLDRTDELIERARALPAAVPDRRLRAESAVIVAIARRLSRLLRRRDPLAGRVRLSKPALVLATLAGLAHAWRPGPPS